MTSAFWDQVEKFLDEALAKGPEHREEFLQRISDPLIRAEVASLLTADENRRELDVHRIVANAAAVTATSGSHLNGVTIGRFRMIELLGRGGMGEVYLAEDLELGRKVALKLLHEDFSHNRERILRFRQEARAASALNHPNILTVFDIGQFGGHTYIATEFVDGTCLSRCLEKGPFEPRELIGIGEQLASGLAAAHEGGILHRDIKPENIMLRKDGLVKILDFGLARITAESGTEPPSSTNTLAGTVLGTPAYMSPEQARGERIDSRSDLWGLGAVLYEMATGKRAFSGESTPDILVSVLQTRPARPSVVRPGLPPLLSELILKLLERDPAARFSSAAEVLQALRHANETLYSGIYQQPYTPKARRRWLSAGALVIVALLAILTALRSSLSPRPVGIRQVTKQIAESRVTAAALSPDGKLLAYATADGIFLEVLQSAALHPLRSAPDFWTDHIAWFPDGTSLLAGGVSQKSLRPGIWSISVLGRAPVLLREDARNPFVSPDSMRIAFTNADQSEIWVAGGGGEAPRKLIDAGEGAKLSILFWTSDSSHLVYQRFRYPIAVDPTWSAPDILGAEIHAEQYESADVQTGAADFGTRNLTMLAAASLPDGRVFYLRQSSHHPEAGYELWQLRTDPKSGKPLGEPRATGLNPDWFFQISAANNGQLALIRTVSSQTVYTGNYSRATGKITDLRRLTVDESSSFAHAWSADSRAVIFESDRRGNNDLYRQALDSRIAEPLVASPEQEFHANVSPDGRWLLFLQGVGGKMSPSRLMRAPVNGGVAEQIPLSGTVDEFRCSMPGGKRCVLRTTDAPHFFTFYELDPVRGVGREIARTRWLRNIYGDWALSPDGTMIAIPNHSTRQAKIRLISLDRPGGSSEREIVVRGVANINGLNWTADGQGWFVVVNTTIGRQLLHVGLQGNATVLNIEASYAIASPDGNKVALVIPSAPANVWLVQGQL